MNFYEIINNIYNESGILAKPKLKSEWENYSNDQEYLPVEYSYDFIEYQFEYYKESGWIDVSIQLFDINDRKIIGIWPLFINTENEIKKISSNGGSIIEPFLLNKLISNKEKTVLKACLDVLNYLIGLKFELSGGLSIILRNANYISEWQKIIEFSGYFKLINLKFESNIYLDESLEILKKNVRKSYKSLINFGLKNWNFRVFYKSSDFDITEFKNFHFIVSGKKTRSDLTWLIQCKNIKNGNAALICSYDISGNIVGGAYFDLTKDEANYSVGVYDRKLFDLPIGHSIQMFALSFLKSIGVKNYRIGIIYKSSDLPIPSEKELAISVFKAGFGGKYVPVFNYKYIN